MQSDAIRAPLIDAVLAWWPDAHRDLPWRHPGTSPYAILVSEIMLQQTPVARVLPVYVEWLTRWPTLAELAAAPSGQAVRQWGKLGYPRRALRLHAAAVACVEHHDSQLPETVPALEALPGIGQYTARAIAAFAFGQRVPVVDVNVRRVLARAIEGNAEAPAAVSKADLALAEALLPSGTDAPVASAALMELGALVCTDRSPSCAACPARGDCAWLLAGRPPATGPPRRSQTFAGTDRQVRGRLLDVLRGSDLPVAIEALDAAWSEPVQRARALDGLVADGLIEPLADGRFALPG